MGTMGDLSPENTITDENGTVIGVENSPLHVSSSFSEYALDMFGRLRVSEPHSLYTDTGAYPIDETRYWAVNQSGSSTYTNDTTTRSYKISTTTANADTIRMQSWRKIEYNKGHSQEIMITGRFSTGKTNLVQRIGYFCDPYGLFFEKSDGTFHVVRRSSTTGSIVDTKVNQANWNLDKLDGTGPSGVNIDLYDGTGNDNMFVWKIDFAWLGVFQVLFSIAVGDKLIPIHKMELSGTLTAPYMDSGQNAVRFEMENDGAVASASSMYVVCLSVKSYGKEIHSGKVRVVDTGTTETTIGTTAQIVAGLRINSSYGRGAIRPLDFEIFPTTGNAWGYFQVLYNPTLTSPTWSSLTGIADGLMNSPSYSGGSVLQSGYFSTASKNSAKASIGGDVDTDIFLGIDCIGNAPSIVLVLQSGSGSFDCTFTGSYEEFL